MRASIALGLRSENVPKHYTVSDGELVLFLWPAEEGGYAVTSPLDPALNTQAESVEEAFVMARDAWELLKEFRSAGAEATPSRRIIERSVEKKGARRPRTASMWSISDPGHLGVEGHLTAHEASVFGKTPEGPQRKFVRLGTS